MEPPPLPAVLATTGTPAGDLALLLRRQHQVVCRGQLLALGFSDAQLRTLRARDWRTVYPGVYIAHTGTLDWDRAWAACLALWPAALGRRTALPEGRNDEDELHLVVGSGAATSRLYGVQVHEKLDFHRGVLWDADPPRQRPEVAVLDALRGVQDVYAHVALITKVCRDRVTSPSMLRDELERRARVTHREVVWNLLGDVESGSHSVLEQEFLTRVLRSHGLPEGRRQVLASGPGGAMVRRDVVLDEFGVAVELDGWMFHASGRQREADLARDLAAVVDGTTTVRLGWQQVTRDSCRTAAALAHLLTSRGWTDAPLCCGPRCVLPRC